MPFTILRPNFYMHNVTELWPPSLDPQGNYYAAARSGLLAAGVAEWLADGLIELYQDYRRPGGYAARVHGTVRDLTGAEPRTLDQALADP